MDAEQKPQRKTVKIKPSAGNVKSFPKRTLEASYDGWAAGLEALGYEFRWNIRAKRVEARSDTMDGWESWRPSNDRIEAHARVIALPTNYSMPVVRNHEDTTKPYRVSKAMWEEYMLAHCLENAFDPFLEYLQSLPEWDGKKRLESLLTDWLGAPDTKLNRFASKQVPVAACVYALAGERDWVKLDEAPLLQGEGGIGKSSLWKFMVQFVDKTWFNDKLKLSDSSKEWAEKLQSRVMAEIPEMVGASRADIATIKMLLTAEDDGGDRLAYARRPEEQPRRAALYSTSNPWHCLPNDEALWRRFIVVECGTVKKWKPKKLGAIKRHVRKNLKQLWAEAFHLAKTEGVPYLPDKLKKAQAAVNAKHGYATDAADYAVLDAADELDGLELRWIIERVGGMARGETAVTAKAGRQVRIGLERAGFVSDRTRYADGRQRTIWFRPSWPGLPKGYAPRTLRQAQYKLGYEITAEKSEADERTREGDAQDADAQ